MIKGEKELKETNIQVVVRLRPRSTKEITENSSICITTNGIKGKEIHLKTNSYESTSKTYTFDRVFGPEASQFLVYNEIVSPILREVLKGYNCTIFAYGQTGTGKTYTMEGDLVNIGDTSMTIGIYCGIIPRTLMNLFEILEREKDEFSVRVSYIELYNEQLKDLLSIDDRKLRIYEDVNKKGGVVISNLEEVLVKSAKDVIQILQRGAQKRQIASTNYNLKSSRSHCVFSITVHIKETTPEGEEMLKVGKLNLVDLAGSENIGRSGAENKRAREAGSINQSLLTLGRVINSLVERSPHIPYRESKLTRLLQDSLGGRTKTCLIATVSPAKSNIEESISTLEYAHRAKNIRNRPEVNQRMTKRALIKDYTDEIERLKLELLYSREKNGVYLPLDIYSNIVEENRVNKELVTEMEKEVLAKDEAMNELTGKFASQQNQITFLSRKLEETNKKLELTKEELSRSEEECEIAKKKLDEQIILTEAHKTTELTLNSIANTLKDLMENNLNDINKLQNKIENKEIISNQNDELFESLKESLNSKFKELDVNIKNYHNKQSEFSQNINKTIKDYLINNNNNIKSTYEYFDKQIVAFLDHYKSTKSISLNYQLFNDSILTKIEAIRSNLVSFIDQKKVDSENKINELCKSISEKLESQILKWDESISNYINKFVEFQKIMTKVITNQNETMDIFKSKVNDFMNENNQLLISQNNELKQYQENYLNEIENRKKILLNNVNKMIESFTSENILSINNIINIVNTSNKTYRNDLGSFSSFMESNINSVNNKLIEDKKLIDSNYNELYIAIKDIEKVPKENISINKENMENIKHFIEEDFKKTNDVLNESNLNQEKEYKKVQEYSENFKLTLGKEEQKIGEMIDSNKKDSIQFISKKVNKNEKNVDELISIINNNEKYSKDFCNILNSNIIVTNENLNKTYSQVKKYIPTMDTPKKKIYSYPKTWELTKPHELIINEYKERQKGDDTISKQETDTTIENENNKLNILKENSVISNIESENEDSIISFKENKKVPINNTKEYSIKPKKRAFNYTNSKDQAEPFNKMQRINRIKQ
ncbi:kinesin-domain-containing protein [Piromyces finnis]|uniref:Kinesin-domain-containing protein n=1 Tax=Piromyces finnis TaxID=1754191 RepID=A0A1Y1VHR8_9FUNG|nr:kinesin-domain-containing protein [Piromyces finnis]|eukprot:ORX55311.1 kinesin-domain-containing protein [Piromyces finnis]